MDEQLVSIAPGYTIRQVKSKFGGLRFYADFPPEVYDEAERLIGLAEKHCAKTCERCSAPGSSHRRNNWVYTLCDTCLMAPPAEKPHDPNRKPVWQLIAEESQKDSKS